MSSTTDNWYSSRGIELRERAKHGEKSLIKQLMDDEGQNIKQTVFLNGRDAVNKFITAAKIIRNSNKKYVLGRRSCFPSAYLFHYVYRTFADNSILVPDSGSQISDEFRWMAKGETLLAISISPYTKEVVDAIGFAKEAEASIIVITDEATSPLAKAADVTFLVEVATLSFWHSNISLAAIVHALLAVLFVQGGDQALRNLMITEAKLATSNAYWRETE